MRLAAFFLAALGPLSAWSQVRPARVWSPPPLIAAPSLLIDLRPGLFPPGHQGNRGTCSVFAAACLGEHLWTSLGREPLKLSEQHLYWQARRDFIDEPELRGYASIDGLPGYVAVKALGGGLVPAESWPYEPDPARSWRTEAERFTGTPPPGLETAYRRDADFTPVMIPRRKIADFLFAEKHPVVVNLMWYFDAADPATGRLRLPTTSERIRCRRWGRGCGGHVVSLVGYDAASREFIFRNSWGTGWGEGGYGRLPEDYLIEDCETCHLLKKKGLSPETRRLVERGSHGWSGEMRAAGVH